MRTHPFLLNTSTPRWYREHRGGTRWDQGLGTVAQWTMRLTVDQDIAGSTPAWLTLRLSECCGGDRGQVPS